MTKQMILTSDGVRWPVFRVPATLDAIDMRSHLFLMHGHRNMSVHDTEILNRECHELDHAERFGSYFVPHVHIPWLTFDSEDEWAWDDE